jgi:hypothetical protein
MNLEELQDALDYYDRTEHPPMPAVDPLVEAARLVANLNIEAGTKAYIEKWVEIAPSTDTKTCFEAGLAAALTTPGDTDGQSNH